MEPLENLDPANLALPDDRIDCLICEKKFTNDQGLRLHISRIHLGMRGNEGEGGEDEEEEEDKEDAESVEDDDQSKDGEDGVKEEKVEVKEGQQTPAVGEEEDNNQADATEEDPLKIDEVKADDSVVKDELPEPKNETAVEEKKRKERESGHEKLEKAKVSDEDRKLIEKMFYRMRRHGCQYCPVRFNSRIKLNMHEAVHRKSTRPMNNKSSPREAEIVGYIPTSRSLANMPFRVGGEGEKAVVCQLCPMSYNDKKGLYQHMFRKHPKTPMGTPIANPFVMSGLNKAPQGYGDDAEEQPVGRRKSAMAPIKLANGLIQCPLCPRTYSSQGGYWIHKKNHHSETSSPANRVTDAKKKFWCDVCGKYYSSYTSLYIHRKNLHPSEPRRSGTSTPPVGGGGGKGGRPMVVNLGDGMHTCLMCKSPFTSLQKLAQHIESVHQAGTGNVNLR